MSFLAKLFRSNKKLDATITLIGPSKSGKTTFVRFLETGIPVEEDLPSTLGIDIREKAIEVGDWRLSALDTGGQTYFQQNFWELAVNQASAVIFVLDATARFDENPELFQLAKEQFAYALDIVPQEVPLLVLLNKQDLVDANPMNPKEAFQVFSEKIFYSRTVAFLPVSAKFGDGVDMAIKWITTKLGPRMN